MQQLPHRITIQKAKDVQDDFSGTTKQWEPVLSNIYAKVTNRMGRESEADDQTNSLVSVFVRIRKRKGVAPDMRVIHGERKLNILAVLPTPDNVFIDLKCEEWVNG
jgi:SPP1 family predicted phage head-tail adaptor